MHSKGTDSHFKVIVVSEEFLGKRLLQRHRQINEILKEEFLSDLHSVTLKAFSIQEYDEF